MTTPRDPPERSGQDPSSLSQLNKAQDGGTVFAVGVGHQTVNLGRDTARYLLYSSDVLQPPQTTANDEWLREQPSRLLDARRQVVDFAGRQDELADLRQWLETNTDVAVRLIHGPGGQGKSRLATHFAQLCAQEGWDVLVARQAGESGMLAATVPSPPPAMSDRGVLVVVDYSDRWSLEDMIQLFSDSSLRSRRRTRFLLLGRGVQAWPALRAVLTDIGARTDDRRLSALATSHADRDVLFRAACDRFGHILKVADAESVERPKNLESDSYALILSLHMAALVAVDAFSRGQRAPSAHDDLAAYLLDREHLNWRRLYRTKSLGEEFDTPPTSMGRAVFLAVLTGPTSHSEGVKTLTSTGVMSPQRVLVDHRVCYPPYDRASVLEPLYPDRLGEDFLALLLPGHAVSGYDPDPWSSEALDLLISNGRDTETRGKDSQILGFMAAAATRWPHVCDKLNAALARDPERAVCAGSVALIAIAEVPGVQMDVLRSIASHFPEERDASVDVGVAAIMERVVMHRLATTDDVATNAKALTNLGLLYMFAGRWDEAGKAVLDARDLIMSLPDDEQDAHASGLAATHTNVSVVLSEIGRPEEAAEASQAALGLYRELHETDPVTYREDVAMALNNYSADLSISGDHALAEQAAREALAIYRSLSSEDPAQYEPDVAMVLGNLGTKLGKLGRHTEALDLSQQCVDIYRDLTASRPAEFQPSLAISLVGLSFDLTNMGQRWESLRAIEEAVDLYRFLADSNPTAYEGDLASAMSSLGNRLAELGKYEEGLDAARSSVVLSRKLADTFPAIYQRELARSICNAAIRLLELKRYREALASVQESHELFLRVAADRNDSDLAWSLETLGEILGANGKSVDAIRAAAEAVDIFRELHDQTPDAEDGFLADALVQLSRRHFEAAEYSTARVFNEEALALYRSLPSDRPKAWELDVAQALIDFAKFRAMEGDEGIHDAVLALEGSLRILGPLNAQFPMVVASDVAAATTLLSELGETSRD